MCPTRQLRRRRCAQVCRCPQSVGSGRRRRARSMTISAMPPTFADPLELRALAGRLNHHADAIRRVRDRAGAASRRDGWHGAAAVAFVAVLSPALASTTRAAVRIDDAADALRRLATAVEGLLEDVRRAAHDGIALLDAGGAASRDIVSDPARVPADLVEVARDAGNVVGDGVAVAGDVLGGAAHLLGL